MLYASSFVIIEVGGAGDGVGEGGITGNPVDGGVIDCWLLREIVYGDIILVIPSVFLNISSNNSFLSLDAFLIASSPKDSN